MSETEIISNPNNLITDGLVKEAVKNDVGENAEVISWKIKNFTKQGDNYSAAVTSILVQFEDNGKTCETSYVAKLNPLRPASALTKLMEIFYARETMVLREIFEGINSQLKKLNEPPIKAPNMYSRCLEKGKEVFLMENLINQGFVMHDRSKGQDIKHALLVVEELGRLHAGSLLFEETLFPKSIQESFDHFEEPWHDFSNPCFKYFNGVLHAQCKGACDFLKNIPKYNKCTEWLKERLESSGELYIEGISPNRPIYALSHGDFWTNNMLFRYNDEGIPVDIRFVDFQRASKASPACDINFFYYTSLNGNIRKKYMKTLNETYYNSFLKVFELAGKEPPFTFSQFEIEMKNRKQFGLMAGLLVLPLVLSVDNDDFMDIGQIREDSLNEFVSAQSAKLTKIFEKEKGQFEDRFLSMFDEMLEDKVFDD